MSSNRSPTSTAYKVQIGDMTLDVPSSDRCWDIRVLYACGCPVSERKFGVVRNMVIRVKQNDHSFPCRLLRCIVGTETHVTLEQCNRCEQLDAQLLSRYIVTYPDSE
ncbi:hypothetical protein F5X97DRAFT_344686 [Nemania serpens]|nr:hypothetical protein F5X97DRAFT_344686 [Nemania serpens]